MKLFGEKFSDFFGVSDDYYENTDFVDEQEIQQKNEDKPQVESTVNETSDTHQNNDREIENVKEDYTESENKYINKKVVDMNNYQPNPNDGNRMTVRKQYRKITVYEPRNYIDCKQVAHSLFKKEIVILSFKHMDERTARRTVDFMTGVVYALDGDIQRLGDELFICTPANVDVDSSMTKNIISTHLHDY